MAGEVRDLVVMEPTAIERMERAQMDSAVDIAKRYPRDEDVFRAKCLKAVNSSQEIAESCFYILERGGKKIEGPGVRLAELAVNYYKNIRCESHIVEITESEVVSHGVAYDVENNVAHRSEVRRRITDRGGKRYNADMITTTCNAANAISFRNAAFKAIPGVFIKEFWDAAKQRAVGDAKSLASRRQKMIASFNQMGVTQADLLRYLKKETVEAIDLDDIATLIGTFNALRDGESTIDETFGVEKPQPSGPKSKAETAKETPQAQPDPPRDQPPAEEEKKGNENLPFTKPKPPAQVLFEKMKEKFGGPVGANRMIQEWTGGKKSSASALTEAEIKDFMAKL